VDAFEKLAKLSLAKKQDRDVIFVMMHCCAQEKDFNPYYAQLALRLCTYNSDYKFSFQVAFYEKFKIITDKQVPQRATINMAKFLAHLVIEGAISLTLLKQADFKDLGLGFRKFFQIFFTTMLSEFNDDKMFDAFKRLALVGRADKSANMVKRSLLYYFAHVFDIPQTAPNKQAFTKKVKYVQKLLKIEFDDTKE